MVTAAQKNGHRNATGGTYIYRISTGHPVFSPRSSTRLRVRPGMAFLYIALLALLALRVLGPVQWRILASGLLPLAGLAILIHRKPLDPLAATRRKGLRPLR